MKYAIALFTVFCTVHLSAAPENWIQDYSAARIKAEKENRPMLVLFMGSDWCPACIRLERTVLSKADFRKYAEENFVPVYLDFSRKNGTSPESEALWKNLRIPEKKFPVTAVVTPDGKSLGAVSGCMTPEIYRQTVDKMKNPPPVLKTVLTGSAADLQNLLKSGGNPDIGGYEGTTPLMQAAAAGSPEKIRLLIRYKADTARADSEGKTALIHAVQSGQYEAVKLLAEAEADLNTLTVEGISALGYAVMQGDKKMVRLLTDLKADLNLPIGEKKIPAYGLALLTEQHGIAELLAEAGTNLKFKDVQGNSALHLAAMIGNEDAVRMLLQKGVSPDEVNHAGRKPADAAFMNSIRRLLEP